MYVKSAGLLLLVLSAACAPTRHPVASVPAPVPAPAPAAPAPAAPEPVMPVEEGVELRGAPSAVGADLLGNAQYDLPVVANEWVRSELEFLVYQRHEVVAGWLRAADRYDEWVRDVFASYGIPRDLHHLGMIESGYRPTVRSHAGAVGMWQFMPATGRGMGLRIDTLVDERMDPVRATHAAARHLRDLHRRMGRDWSLAAAAYNAGEGRINRAMGRYNATDFWDVAQRGNLALETRRYVPRLYAMTIIAKDPQRFGYPPLTGGRRFAYDSMRVDLATPLSVLAQIGNLPASELVDLNPHLFRQVAPRNYWVWVPLGQGTPLQQAYAASEFRQRGGFGVYRVREGESLARLAELSGVPAERIRAMNLSTNVDNLRAGDRLRLYTDAVRLLDARPAERRGEASSSSARRNTESASSSSGSRRNGESASSEGRSGSSESTRGASSERRSESGASERAASPERRSGSGSSERSASPERRSEPGSASSSRSSSSSSSSASSSRRSEGTRGGSSSSTSGGQTHTVEDGETLWGIARRFEVTVDAVREANDLDEDDHIQPGQTLRIPRAAGSATASAGGTRAEPGSRTASGERRASGESASSSSRRSGETASAEPRTGRSSSTRPALSTVARSGGARTAGREHTVGEGETLWGIARRYDTTVDSLRRANDLDEDDAIRPGQKLRIPEN